MPSGIGQGGGRLLAVLVSRAGAGQLDADHCTTLGEDAPAAVVGAVPVLVGDERLVIGLADLLHPERHSEVLGITELEGVGVAEGHVVVERTILEVLHVDALTALAGLEGRGAHRLGGNGTLQVGVVTVEGQVSHQAAAQHGRIGQGRADLQNGVRRGHTAALVRNHHAVVAGIAQLDRGDDEGRVGGARDVVAVELPLVADAFAATFGNEGRLAACDQVEAHRRDGEDRL